MNITKQIIGIDVSMDTLEACYGTYGSDNKKKLSGTKSFKNLEAGFNKLINWAEEHIDSSKEEVVFVMEATGVYYEKLAYYLAERNKKVAVVLPNKAKAFSKTRDIKSKTDKLDAAMLTEMGLEKELRLWKKPDNTIKELKQLSRAYKSVKEKITVVKNQLHALEHAYQSNELVKTTLQQELIVHKKAVKKYQKRIKDIIKSNPQLKQKIDNILPAKGIGLMSIVTVVAETDGFALIENSKQLASYAGLDVVHRESGLFKGKTKISKKGNSIIRAALYMPALSAIRTNQRLKQFYKKIIERKGIPGIGIIAVARKMLQLIYILWKKNELYDPNYAIA